MARVRRSKEASRAAILAAAERILLKDGPEAVRVQRVAAAVGVTDAAVHYHFGNRTGLVEALLRQCGRKLVAYIEAATAEEAGLAAVSQAMRLAYGEGGGARMVMWLKLAGWRPSGAGMFATLAARAAGPGVDLQEAKRLIALLNTVHLATAILGDALLSAADLPADAEGQARFLDWTTALVAERLAG